MPRARENFSLTMTEYDIAGNAIRAYYDNSHKLIFVLDDTINADKPNVLLVIDSFDGRKWDDVLSNDYHVDLETVRPKRDNKYQKLDIEYGGLDVYSELIDAYDAGDDLTDALANLTRFRAMSVRRAASERLAAAEETIEKSQETIERTNESMNQLRSRVKELRARISEHRRGIGREPTKASAAKILKTEAQLDATNEKLSRAKKRLASAQRRLTTAEEDAEIARAILDRDIPVVATSRPRRKSQPVVVKPVAVAEETYTEQDDYDPEPKAEEMDNDEVKPLFDKDPENLDDNIAFKPINFNAVESVHEQQAPVTVDTDDTVGDEIAPAPLAFTPPQSRTETIVDDEPKEDVSPMLDSLTSVPDVEEAPSVVDTTDAPAPEPFVAEAPLPPVSPVAATRPISPITGTSAPIAEPKPQKPTVIYYFLLLLLILLSIGTLWLYQKSTSGNIPNLAKTVTETADEAPAAKPVVAEPVAVPSPFVAVPNIVKERVEEPAPVPEPAVVVAPVVVPEPVSIEPEPVVVEQPAPTIVEEPTVDVDVEPESVQVVVESPFVMPEPAATYEPEPVKIPSEQEVIASKPGYNVSQNEQMFVAGPDYDTEAIYSEEPVESVCEGGAEPDSLGCCPGENYTYTDDGFMCCNGVECFPPAE